MSPTDDRREQAHRFAVELGLEGEPLYAAATAAWSNLNPQTVSFDTALSVAGVALRAAAAVSPGSAAPALAAQPDGPLDQARGLIVQAGVACTHLAAIAPDGPAAARQATQIIGLLSQVRDLVGGQPAAAEAPPVAQLAVRVETAAEVLRGRVSVGSGPLSGESAAEVAGNLQAALDHIANTLWPAISDALPHAARHLEVAATRIGLTADLLGSAGLSTAATAGRTADFPGNVQPVAPGQGAQHAHTHARRHPGQSPQATRGQGPR